MSLNKYIDMKNHLLLSCATVLLGCYANAQPVINASDYDLSSDTLFDFKYDVNQIDPGQAGANVTWDFSNLYFSDDYPVIPHTCPAGSECFNFPNATEYLETDLDANVFYKQTSSELTEVGMTNGMGGTTTYTTPYVFMKFPMTFNQSYSSSYSADLNQSGIVYTQNGNYSTVVDGYGTLITPSGTFTDVLRQKRVDVSQYAAGTITMTTTMTEYDWYKAGIHQPLMTSIGTEIALSNGTPGPEPTYVVTYLIPGTTGIKSKQILDQSVQVYPNPAHSGQSIRVSIKDNQATNIKLTNVLGQTVYQWENEQGNMAKMFSLPINTSSLAKGIYQLTINTEKGSLTKKISIL